MKWREIKTDYSSRLAELRARNPFELLEVDPKASLKEIKAAYRKKVRAYHPDKTDPFLKNHCEEVTRLLNQALETIKRDFE